METLFLFLPPEWTVLAIAVLGIGAMLRVVRLARVLRLLAALLLLSAAGPLLDVVFGMLPWWLLLLLLAAMSISLFRWAHLLADRRRRVRPDDRDAGGGCGARVLPVAPPPVPHSWVAPVSADELIV